MFASVAVFAKLPHSFDSLEYEIPEPLRPVIGIGALVFVPFRTKTILGLVLAVYDRPQTEKNLESVTSWLGQTLPASYVRTLIRSASYFATTPNWLAAALIPTPPKRLKMLGQFQAQTQERFRLRKATVNCISAWSDDELINEIRGLVKRDRKTGHQTLVIVPRQSDLKVISARLPKATASLDEKLSPKKVWELWQNTLAGSIQTLVTTRRGALWPMPKLGSICLYREEISDHKQSDLKPRYDARTVARFLSEETGAELFYLSQTPRLATLYQSRVRHLGQPKKIRIILHESGAGRELLPPPTLELIDETLTSGARLVIIGALEKMSRIMNERYPNRTNQITLIRESETIELRAKTLEDANLVIWVHPESALQSPEFSAEEELFQHLRLVRNHLSPDSTFVIVSKNALPLFGGLHPERETYFLERMLQERREAGYPPFGSFIKLIVQDSTMAKAMARATMIGAQFAEPDLEALGPYEAFPRLVRGKYRCLINLQGPPLTLEALKPRLKLLHDQILIDVDPERIFR